jgi:hypothetical protein
VAVPALAFLVANLVDWPWHVAGMGAIWSTAAAALIAAGRAGPPPGRIPSPAPPGRMGLHRKA